VNKKPIILYKKQNNSPEGRLWDLFNNNKKDIRTMPLKQDFEFFKLHY